MILGFGEIMMRLAPPDFLRLRQTLPGRLDATFSGAEANVCVSLALLGQKSRLLTFLPVNPLTDALLAQLKEIGVDTSAVHQRAAGRLGIYFVETGANQRSSTVLYDRTESAIALAEPKEYDFERVLEDVTWVHTTGITPALSQAAFEATLTLLKAAKARGIPASINLNFS